MGILVLVLLVAAWGLVLGPALLRNAKDPSPIETEKMFSRALRALGGTRRPKPFGGRWVMVPRSPDYPPTPPGGSARRPRVGAAAERRRRNLTFVGGFIIATFLLGMFRPLRFLLYLNIVADAVFIAYLGAVLYFSARPVKSHASKAERAAPPSEAAGGF